MPFTDRTVVITGASGNLGRAVAKAFAELNARLALLDLRRGDVQDGPNQVFLEVDLLNPESVADRAGLASPYARPALLPVTVSGALPTVNVPFGKLVKE